MSRINELLLAKAAKEKYENEPIRFRVEGSESVMEIKRPSAKRIMEIQEHMDENAKQIEFYDELIYEAIPEFRDMLKEYECEEDPVAIVGKFFCIGDRVELGNEILKSINNVSVEILKN